MEEDTELEEGEAKEACDPDTDLSYIDKKLHDLLGDCQREFQGGNLSTEKLGSKFGGYGSFLPSEIRTPSVLTKPHPPPPATEPIRGPMEGLKEHVKRFTGAADKAPLVPSSETTLPQVSRKKNGVTGNTNAGKKVKLKIKLDTGGGKEKDAKLKALYSGLCLADSSSVSLEDDDTNTLSDDSSPDHSPMTMIQMMTSYQGPPGGLLSPLPDLLLEPAGRKEKASLKVDKQQNAGANVRNSLGKVDSEVSVNGNNEDRKDQVKERDKQPMIEPKKVGDLVGDSVKRAKSYLDVEKKNGKKVAKVLIKEASKVVEQEGPSEKGGEAPSKEDMESSKELLPKSSRSKQPEPTAEPSGIGGREKEGSNAKAPRKPSAPRGKDNKQISRSKDMAKEQARKDRETAKGMTTKKEITAKGETVSDTHRRAKEESKEAPAPKTKELPKESWKENQRKDLVSDSKARDGQKDTSKLVGKTESATKRDHGNPAARREVTKDQKGSKSVRVVQKELDREPAPEANGEAENGAGRVEPPATTVVLSDTGAAPAVAPQLVLDNWVACDKCEQWRLLLPNMDPKFLPKKWRCKMMDWLPGMNNCKFTEAETTAAMYSYLGGQNPTLPPAPAEMQPPPPVVQPVLEKLADTKKGSRGSTAKKGLARKIPPSVPKAGGSKGDDGAVKSKSLNEVGHDGSADDATHLHRRKLKDKEKLKRKRTSEGDDMPPKKKILWEEESNQGSALKQAGGVYTEELQLEKESLDTESNRFGSERHVLEALPTDRELKHASTVQVKRKMMMNDELLFAKKSKAMRIKAPSSEGQQGSDEEDGEVGEGFGALKSKSASALKRVHDASHSRQANGDTEDILGMRESFQQHDSGDSERDGVERDTTKRVGLVITEERRANLVESDKKRRVKEDEIESDHRTGKRRKQDVHPHLELKGRGTRPNLPSEQDPVEPVEAAVSPAPSSIPKDVAASRKTVIGKATFKPCTAPKLSPSLSESSGTGSKARGSPIESTVSSSPVRFNKGDRRDGPRSLSVHNEDGVQGRSCSQSPKPEGEGEASHRSWDEGEFRHAGGRHGAEAFCKYDRGRGGRDEEWYYDEHRGPNPGFGYDRYRELSPERSERYRDRDGRDGRYERRASRDDRFERGRDRAGRDIWPNDHGDVRDDRYSREHSTRDDWGRPSSRESRLDKPSGGLAWRDDRQLERTEVPTKDEPLRSVMQEHVAKDDPTPNKCASWEGDRPAPVRSKESEAGTGRPLDTVVPINRTTTMSNTRIKGKQGEALKQEELQGTRLKSLTNTVRDGEGATGSPGKKEHVHGQVTANVAMKEAKDLKHSADRLKGKAGLEGESTNLYLQAALKFLQAAAMLEPVFAENARLGEVTQSMLVYHDTAKLCEFCAITYERSRDMAAAALAYTCAAVARARVMLSKTASFARDRIELQAATQLPPGLNTTTNLPLPPPQLPSRSVEKPGPSLVMAPVSGIGESPSSSSASDVDNLNINNQTLLTSEKGTMSQMGKACVASPQTMAAAAIPTSQFAPAHLRPQFVRILRDSTDMTAMLEAWAKAASVTAAAEASCGGVGMMAVKRVGELGGFGDIHVVVRLVREAMEAIGH